MKKHKGYVGKVEEVNIPEHPFPFPELRPYQKAVFEEMKKGKKFDEYLLPKRPYSVGVDFGSKDGDKTVVAGAMRGRNGKIYMWFDEFAEMPNYKWYRNPIKWYQWRKLWKGLSKKV